MNPTAGTSEKIIPFDFGEHRIRVVLDKHGEPWFLSPDIAQALENRDADKLTRKLSVNEQRSGVIGTRRGFRDVITISGSGLCKLVVHSGKPEARRFQKWLTSTVLPAVRLLSEDNNHAS